MCKKERRSVSDDKTTTKADSQEVANLSTLQSNGCILNRTTVKPAQENAILPYHTAVTSP